MKTARAKKQQKAASRAFDAAVGDRIRTRRLAAGFSQQVLADKIGGTGSQVSRIEAGEISCEPAILARIGQALNCKASDFVDGIEV